MELPIDKRPVCYGFSLLGSLAHYVSLGKQLNKVFTKQAFTSGSVGDDANSINWLMGGNV